MNQHETNFWLGTWEGGWWLVPPLAVLGGAWASGEQPLERVELALALALVLAGWLPLWRALSGTDWLTPLRAWRAWEAEVALPRWPYLQEGTPGAALHRRLRQAVAWWRALGAQRLSLTVRTVLLSLVLSALLSLAIGREALLLTALFITLSQIALLWDEQGRMPSFFQALLGVGLPWLLGGGLGDRGHLGAVALVLSVAIAACWRGRNSASALGMAPLLLLLVGLGRPFAAGWIALCAVPLITLNLLPLETAAYRRRSAIWVLALVVLTAGAWAWKG